MLSPKPLPSVFRELSPRTKRSISSSPLMFSCWAEILRKVTVARPASLSRLIYTRVPAMAYLHTLFSKLSKTRHMCRPSAIIVTGSFGFVTTSSSPAAFSFSAYSPAHWSMSTPSSQRSKLTFRLPVLALEASIRSSMSFFSLADWRDRTSRYSLAFSLSISSFSSRST